MRSLPCPGQNRADALVDGFAHSVHDRGVAQPQPGRARRLGCADAAEHEARGADALEICGELSDHRDLRRGDRPKTVQIRPNQALGKPKGDIEPPPPKLLSKLLRRVIAIQSVTVTRLET